MCRCNRELKRRVLRLLLLVGGLTTLNTVGVARVGCDIGPAPLPPECDTCTTSNRVCLVERWGPAGCSSTCPCGCSNGRYWINYNDGQDPAYAGYSSGEVGENDVDTKPLCIQTGYCNYKTVWVLFECLDPDYSCFTPCDADGNTYVFPGSRFDVPAGCGVEWEMKVDFCTAWS